MLQSQGPQPGRQDEHGLTAPPPHELEQHTSRHPLLQVPPTKMHNRPTTTKIRQQSSIATNSRMQHKMLASAVPTMFVLAQPFTVLVIMLLGNPNIDPSSPILIAIELDGKDVFLGVFALASMVGDFDSDDASASVRAR